MSLDHHLNAFASPRALRELKMFERERAELQEYLASPRALHEIAMLAHGRAEFERSLGEAESAVAGARQLTAQIADLFATQDPTA